MSIQGKKIPKMHWRALTCHCSVNIATKDASGYADKTWERSEAEKEELGRFWGQNPKLSRQLEFGAKSIEKKFNLKIYVVKSTKQEQGGYV